MTPSKAIARLLATGRTESAIASLVGTTQSTINRIRHGRDPRWTLGQRLIELAGLSRHRK